ncbi:tape measure domain-containing protein [Anaerovibrio lipolyticus DSM 3074]|uniref:Tape measure domain-containing protein n=1 Tax=Anaerovibrio lipolyticus DSM 3074 TaxID=1120997 RepID=A0A1M6CM06_9FIRM|nr:tape measure protein [Anaerovibrio lipolyticus]SHI61804.1 tape measure domain-containing protein [Anaerovibrio lipolyticus DSM 3074]
MGTVRELITKIVWRADTSGIKQAQKAEENFGSSARKAGNTAQQSMSNATRSQNNLKRAVSNTSSSMAKLSATSAMTGANIQRSMSGATNSISLLTSKLGAMAAAMTAAFSVGKVKSMADEVMGLDNRLRTIEADADKRKALRGQLFDMSQNARTDYMAASDLFFGINRGIKNDPEFTREDAIRATEIVSKALTLEGASEAQAQGAILQLKQGLGSGVLQGDELHSLNESASLLMQEMARSMGVEQGQLKEMGAKGLLTRSTVLRAILASGKTIDEQFGMSTQTIGQSMQKISNSFYKGVEGIEERTHVFARIAQFIEDTFNGITKIVSDAVAIWDGDTEKMAENPKLTRFIKYLKKIEKTFDDIRTGFKVDFDFGKFDFSPLEMLMDLLEKGQQINAAFWKGLEQGWLLVQEFMGDGLDDLAEAWENIMNAIEPFMPLLEKLAEWLGTGIMTVGVLAFRTIAWNIKKASEVLEAMGNIVRDVAGELSKLINLTIDALTWLGLVEKRSSGFSNAGWERAMQSMGVSQPGISYGDRIQTNTFNVGNPMDAYKIQQNNNSFFAYNGG